MQKPPNPGDDVFSSALAKASAHFKAEDAPEDTLTRTATRIGRALSGLAFLALAWYFGHQLKVW